MTYPGNKAVLLRITVCFYVLGVASTALLHFIGNGSKK
jgi:hypothetical protein